jgi:hypothetical protein
LASAAAAMSRPHHLQFSLGRFQMKFPKWRTTSRGRTHGAKYKMHSLRVHTMYLSAGGKERNRPRRTHK